VQDAAGREVSDEQDLPEATVDRRGRLGKVHGPYRAGLQPSERGDVVGASAMPRPVAPFEQPDQRVGWDLGKQGPKEADVGNRRDQREDREEGMAQRMRYVERRPTAQADATPLATPAFTPRS